MPGGQPGVIILCFAPHYPHLHLSLLKLLLPNIKQTTNASIIALSPLQSILGQRPQLNGGQVRLGQVRLCQVRLGFVRLGQVRLGQVRSDPVVKLFGAEFVLILFFAFISYCITNKDLVRIVFRMNSFNKSLLIYFSEMM